MSPKILYYSCVFFFDRTTEDLADVGLPLQELDNYLAGGIVVYNLTSHQPLHQINLELTMVGVHIVLSVRESFFNHAHHIYFAFFLSILSSSFPPFPLLSFIFIA